MPSEQTGGIGVDAAGENLPEVMGTSWPPATSWMRSPAGSLRSCWARRPPRPCRSPAPTTRHGLPGGNGSRSMGSCDPRARHVAGHTAFISLPVAERLFQTAPNPSEIYVRAGQNDVPGVANLLGATADPQDASGVRSAGRRTCWRPVPPRRVSSRRCCWAWAPSRCSSARSGSPTSWSSRCSSAARDRHATLARGHPAPHQLQFLAESALLAAMGASPAWASERARPRPTRSARRAVRRAAVCADRRAARRAVIGAVAGLYPAARRRGSARPRRCGPDPGGHRALRGGSPAAPGHIVVSVLMLDPVAADNRCNASVDTGRPGGAGRVGRRL